MIKGLKCKVLIIDELSFIDSGRFKPGPLIEETPAYFDSLAVKNANNMLINVLKFNAERDRGVLSFKKS